MTSPFLFYFIVFLRIGHKHWKSFADIPHSLAPCLAQFSTRPAMRTSIFVRLKNKEFKIRSLLISGFDYTPVEINKFNLIEAVFSRDY